MTLNKILIVGLLLIIVTVMPVMAEVNNTHMNDGKTQVPNGSYWIKIDPIGDKIMGENISVTAATNLPVGAEVLVWVSTSSPPLCTKSKCYDTHTDGRIIVNSGDNNINKTFFEFDTSIFKPNEYLLSESAIEQNTSEFILFYIQESSIPVLPSTPPLTKSPLSIFLPGLALIGSVFISLFFRKREKRD